MRERVRTIMRRAAGTGSRLRTEVIDRRPQLRRRLVVVAVALGLWTTGIQARLVVLQIFEHDELIARAERQQLRTITAPAKRGEILDRNGRVLAYSVDADSIYAVPSEIENPRHVAELLCTALDRCSNRERDAIAARLSGQRAFAYVRRQVVPDVAARIADLNLTGIGFLKENRRYYPNWSLAAHLLGYVGIDNQGLHGIEAVYDAQIRGRSGTTLIQIDARRRAFSRVERPPTAGATIELTIDEVLQHIAERELRAGVTENRAEGGTVIIMDPNSGEILALANEPTFNPNAFARAPEAHRRNRATQDVYEPGSTFKVVTAAAALEERVIRPDELIDVSAGTIAFGARQIEDDHRYDVLSFEDVIVKSSNVGAIKIGLMLGPERLGRYLRRFGFGQTLSRDFAGESPGIVWDPAGWSDSALASVAMGYQIGVTALQMATATSAVANGGELVEPRVVRAVVHDGARTMMPRHVIRRTMRPDTAAELVTIMEGVVQRGTARAAQVPGYTVAGKTGTAAKLVGGRYSRADYNASFIGFLPSRDPVVAILVVIDTPRARGYYGGVAAAPVFQRIAGATMRYLAVPPTINPMPPVLRERRDDDGWGARARPAVLLTPKVLAPAAIPADRGLMPDLRGMSARTALHALASVGLPVRLDGDGFVIHQVPAPGSSVQSGMMCELSLSRQPMATGDLPSPTP